VWELVQRLTNAQEWVVIGFARSESEGGIQYFVGEGGACGVVEASNGLFEFQVLDGAITIDDLVRQYVSVFLETDEPGAVFVTQEAPASSNGFAARRFENGAIEVAQGATESVEITEVSLDDAIQIAGNYVR
jgi:hypothetical protein